MTEYWKTCRSKIKAWPAGGGASTKSNNAKDGTQQTTTTMTFERQKGVVLVFLKWSKVRNVARPGVESIDIDSWDYKAGWFMKRASRTSNNVKVESSEQIKDRVKHQQAMKRA